MKLAKVLALASLLAIGAVGCPDDTSGEAPDGTTSTDGTDATDTDGTDATETDGTDGTDASETDGTGVTDGTEGTDVTDGTDGTEGTDVTDGTDGTDMTDAGTDTTDHMGGDGATCDEAILVDAIPFTDSNTTMGAGANYGYDEGACPGDEFDNAWGDASQDRAYAFTPDANGVYTITLTPGESFDSNLYVVTDCANVNGSCLGADDEVNISEELNVELVAGTTYFIIVDGYDDDDDEAGSYELTIGEPCTPTCGSNTCGPNGCGGVCGTCQIGDACDAGTCITLPTTCQPATTIACNQTLTGLTNGTSATAAFSQYSCNVFPDDDYGPGVELTLELTTPDVAQVTVTGSGDGGLDLAVLQDAGSGCEDTGSNCIAHVGSSATFESVAGATYYLIWDPYNGATVVDDFSVEVECCIPSCDGKECGSDGCGGSCGSCEEGVCVQGTCGILPTECSALGTVACGDKVSGVSNAMSGSVMAFGTYSCQEHSDDYTASPESVWTFTADVNQKVTITGTDDGPLEVTVLEDDGNGCEDVTSTCVGNAISSLTFDALAGSTYYVIWDSWSSATPIVEDFSFSVECCESSCDGVECGGDDGCGGTCGCAAGNTCFEGFCCEPFCDGVFCGDTSDDGCGGTCGCPGVDVCDTEIGECTAPPEGDACQAPFIVDSLPFVDTGDTVSFYSNYAFGSSSCPGSNFAKGSGAEDVVYALTPVDSGIYTITLTPEEGFDSALYVATDCADISATCLGGQDAFGDETLSLSLEAGTTYYIYVDGYTSGESGEYTLSVSEPCFPQCDGAECGSDGCGSTCGPPCEMGQICDAGVCTVAETVCSPAASLECNQTLTLQSNGSTGGTYAFDEYSCHAGPFLGPEIVYELVAADDSIVTVTASDDGPLELQVLADTGFGCADYPDGACLGWGSSSVTFDAAAGGAYYISFDSSDPEEPVVNDFGVEVECCIPQGCDGLTCNDNGCGGLCNCAEGTVCGDGAQCVTPIEGDVCENAFVLDGDLPISYSGDNSNGFTGNYGSDNTCNSGGSNSEDPTLADVVHAFTPETSGTYEIDMPNFVNGDGPSLVYVTTNCDSTTFGATCLGYVDFYTFGIPPEPLEVQLEAGTTYYIIVDSFTDVEIGSYQFTLTLLP